MAFRVLPTISIAEVRVASAEDTILAKLDWYERGNRVSDRHWSDVLGIMRVQSKALDLIYLEHWAEKSGRLGLLKQALAEAEQKDS